MKLLFLPLVAIAFLMTMPSEALADDCSCYQQGVQFGAGNPGASYGASNVPPGCAHDTATSTGPFGMGVFNGRAGNQADSQQFCGNAGASSSGGTGEAPALHWYAQGVVAKMFDTCQGDYPHLLPGGTHCGQTCETGYGGWSLPGNNVCVKCPFVPSNVRHNGDGSFTCIP